MYAYYRCVVVLVVCALLLPLQPAAAHPSFAVARSSAAINAAAERASPRPAAQLAPIPLAPSQPSTSVAATRAPEFVQAYEARHGLVVADLDVAQFSAPAVQTHQIAAITVGGTGDTDPHDSVVRLPPGLHTSMLLDVQAASNNSLNAAAQLSTSNDGVTWDYVAALAQKADGLVARRVSLGAKAVPGQPLFLRFRCIAASIAKASTTVTCSFRNLRFFNDTPIERWFWADTNEFYNVAGPSYRFLTSVHTTPYQGIPLPTTILAGESGYLTLETVPGQARTLDFINYRSPDLQLPFVTSGETRVAFSWARSLPGAASGASAGGMSVSFVPSVGQTTTVASIPAGGDQAWTDVISVALPARLSGATGFFVVRINDSTTPRVIGIDGLRLVRTGQVEPIPQDQTVRPCPCEYAGVSQALANGSVNTGSGAFVTEATDLVVASTGPALALTRSYASLLANPATTPVTSFGPGWRHAFASALTLSTATGGEPNTLIYEAATGNRLRFADAGGSVLYPLSGIRATLQRNTDGTYTLTTRDQATEHFDSTGRLLERRDAAGQRQTLSYASGTGTSADGQLQTVTDVGSGRTLTFDYQAVNGQARISAVHDSAQRSVNYTYTAQGDLATASDLRGGVTTYTYSDARRLLTGVQRPDGTTAVTVRYDSARRVDQQTDATGLVTTFAYATLASTRTTTITRQRAGSTLDQAVDHYRLDNTLQYQERDGKLQRYVTFGRDLAPTTLVDGAGQATLLSTNGVGQVTSVLDAAGTTASANYRADRRLNQTVSPSGATTDVAYDGRGNATAVTTTGVDGLRQTTLYTYTLENRLQAQQAADGVVTGYSYTPQGQVEQVTVGVGTPLAQQTSSSYDAVGRVTTSTVGLGTPLARTDHTVYNADGTVARTIQNYQDGVFDGQQPDADVSTRFGYDGRGRLVWTQDALGRYDLTRYDAAGRVDWTLANAQIAGWNEGVLPATPPAFVPALPDQNVATVYGYDVLGRTTLVTETGILTGTFDLTTRAFSAATTRVTRTEYDALSRPVTTTLNYRPDLPVGTLPDVNVQTAVAYDGANNVIWQRDALGRATWTAYDGANRPMLTTRNYENGDPASVASANQGWTDGSDSDLRTVTRYTPDGQVRRTIANVVDQVFWGNDPLSDISTLYDYDSLGRPTTTGVNYASAADYRVPTPAPPPAGPFRAYTPLMAGADALDPQLSRSTTTRYDPLTGRVQGTRDALGRWTSVQYDVLGRPTVTIANCTGALAPATCAPFTPTVPDANVPTTTSYDALGRVDTVTNALGVVMRTSYDGLSRVVATTANYVAGGPVDQHTNVTTRTGYNALGQAVTSTDAANATASMTYDALGRMRTSTDAALRVTEQATDATGTARWTRSPDGRVTVTQVDGLGRVVATISNYEDGLVAVNEPADRDLVTRVAYDLGGRQIQAVAPDGRITAFGYDLEDRLVSVTENVATGTCVHAPCNVVTRYTYDRLGNRTSIIDARSVVAQQWTHTSAGEVETQTVGGQPRGTWTYDDSGQVTTWLNGDNLLGYGYDGLGRTQTISSTGLLITHQYDALGRRTALQDATGTTTFTPDPLGRLIQVQAPQTGAVGYTYTARSERASITYPGGRTIAYEYLPDGQLDTVREGLTLLADYTYDPVGRLDTLVRGNNVPTTYAYDGGDRLTSTTTGNSTFGYGYNRAGLRTQVNETLGGSTRTVIYGYDGLQRLTGADASTGADYTYSYDLAGNRTDGGQQYNAASQVIGFAYDGAGNLTGDGTNSYSYDALGRMTTQDGKTHQYNGDGVLVASGATRYTQDLLAPLDQVLGDGTSSYVYGLGRLFGQAGSTRTWYATDALGSVRQTLSDTGTALTSATYTPWGVSESGVSAPFGFTGELTSGELVYLRARWYDPANGTLTTPDPFIGFTERPYSLHSYQYAYSNPLVYGDPSGRTPACLAALLAGPAGVPLTGGCLAVAAVLAVGITTVASYQAWECAQRSCLVEPVQQVVAATTQQSTTTYAPPQVATEDVEYVDMPEGNDEGPDYEPSPPVSTGGKIAAGVAIATLIGATITSVAPCPPAEKSERRYSRTVLVVGEHSSSHEYSRNLAAAHPDWQIIGSSYGSGSNMQVPLPSQGNLTIVQEVDATRLAQGAITGGRRFNDIIFNAPRAAGSKSFKNTPLLIDQFLQSARTVLQQGGAARVSSTDAMPGGGRLGYLVNHLPGGYRAAFKRRYESDDRFGVPYTILNNEGDSLYPPGRFKPQVYWFAFQKD